MLIIDRGSYAIVRPVPGDVAAALCGAHAGPGPTSEQIRAEERASDHETSERRRPTA